MIYLIGYFVFVILLIILTVRKEMKEDDISRNDFIGIIFLSILVFPLIYALLYDLVHLQDVILFKKKER